MTRAGLVTAVISIAMSVVPVSARAQPSATPPDPSMPQPPPTPGTMQPAPPTQPIALTPEDQELLAQGEMPTMTHALGAGLSVVVGFGTGQLAEGRWADTGWIFTLGDVAAYAAIIEGIHQLDITCVNAVCTTHGSAALLVAGVVGELGLHVWQVLDAILVPAKRNARVRALRARLGMPPQPQPMGLFVVPGERGGAVAGLTLRF